MHYMMSSTLYRVHWSKIHYTESRSPLSFDQLHPAAQSPIRSTLFLQVPYSRSRSPVYPVTPSCVLCPKENTFSVLLASWQRIPFFTSAMAANSAVQLLTVICLELTKEDKETFKIKSAKRLVVLWRRFISARDESRNCRTRKVQHSSNLTSQVHWRSLSFDATRIPCLAGHCCQ